MNTERIGASENRLAVRDTLWEADRKHGLVGYGRFAMNVMCLEKRIERGGALDPEVTPSGKTPIAPIKPEPKVTQVLAGPVLKIFGRERGGDG